MTLPTNRTTASTAAEHVADHNLVHASVNLLDSGAYVPVGGAAGADYPTGVIAATRPRGDMGSSVGPFVLGQQCFNLIRLEVGQIVTNIAWATGSSGWGTPTNQWFSLYSLALAKLAVTGDDLTTAWGANTLKTLALSAPYTVTVGGLYYVGLMVAGATAGNGVGITPTNNVAVNLPPVVSGKDATNTGLTTPVTAPATAADLTSLATSFYAHVS